MAGPPRPVSKRPPGGGCEVHRIHVPKCYVPDVHHIWPRGEGGPDVQENKVVTCPTGHRNIHELMRLLEHGQATLDAFAFFSPKEQELAARGWAAISKHREQQK